MQYRGFRAFCVAAKHLSFKVAADELFVSPSAISHQIRDLESYLGCKLFTRHTRSIALTLQGRTLLDQVLPHVEAIDSASQRLRAQPSRVPLRIEAPAFFASELLLPRLNEFSAAHREIDLCIETVDPTAQVRHIADLNIQLVDRPPQSDHRRQLFSLKYQPACSPKIYDRWRSCRPEDLAEATLLVLQARPQAWNQWLQLAGASHCTPAQTISIDSMYGLAKAAEQSAGIALIPLPVSQAWFENGALLPLFDTELPSADNYWMTCESSVCERPGLATLWQWIADSFCRDE